MGVGIGWGEALVGRTTMAGSCAAGGPRRGGPRCRRLSLARGVDRVLVDAAWVRAPCGVPLRVLAIDESSAAVVRRIFVEYLDGNGDRAIAGGLNPRRRPLPVNAATRPESAPAGRGLAGQHAARDPRHRRYTGYAVFGRWTQEERLANPDDVAAGHVTRFRRAEPEQVVRSQTQAHPAIRHAHTGAGLAATHPRTVHLAERTVLPALRSNDRSTRA